MKIIFFGSSDYCLPILKALTQNFNLGGIITRPDRHPLLFAQKNKISFFTPKDKAGLISMKNQLKQINPDIAVVADYGLIIPAEIFKVPKYKTLNIHFSKLPKLRGASPVQYTILLGENSAWITIIVMDETMDTGGIVWQREINKLSNETTGSLYKKLFKVAAKELPNLINLYTQGKFTPKKQDHSQATYTKLLTRDDGFIPPKILQSAINGEKIDLNLLQTWPLYKLIPFELSTNNYQLITERALRAFIPWPGLWTEITITANAKDTSDGGPATAGTPPRWRNLEQKRLKILKAHLEEDKLILDQVQLEGKKPVSFKQFKEGHPQFSF